MSKSIKIIIWGLSLPILLGFIFSRPISQIDAIMRLLAFFWVFIGLLGMVSLLRRWGFLRVIFGMDGLNKINTSLLIFLVLLLTVSEAFVEASLTNYYGPAQIGGSIAFPKSFEEIVYVSWWLILEEVVRFGFFFYFFAKGLRIVAYLINSLAFGLIHWSRYYELQQSSLAAQEIGFAFIVVGISTAFLVGFILLFVGLHTGLWCAIILHFLTNHVTIGLAFGTPLVNAMLGLSLYIVALWLATKLLPRILASTPLAPSR